MRLERHQAITGINEATLTVVQDPASIAMGMKFQFWHGFNDGKLR